MDAIEFIKARNRICKQQNYSCRSACPLKDHACGLSTFNTDEEIKTMIEVVEKWAAEHPAKTRQSDLLKLFPEAALDDKGVCKICPAYVRLGNGKRNCLDPKAKCYECRRKFWLEEVE